MASCRVANAFLTRLKLIWPKSSLKNAKMSKNAFFAKSSGGQWVNITFKIFIMAGAKFKLKVTVDYQATNGAKKRCVKP